MKVPLTNGILIQNISMVEDNSHNRITPCCIYSCKILGYIKIIFLYILKDFFFSVIKENCKNKYNYHDYLYWNTVTKPNSDVETGL